MAANVRHALSSGRRNSLEELEAVALDVLSQVKPRPADKVGTLSGVSEVSELPRKKAENFEVEQWRPCPHCGNKVAAMYRSCRHCGHRVE